MAGKAEYRSAKRSRKLIKDAVVELMAQHHRRILNEFRLLLVRRTRKRTAAKGRRRARHLPDLEPGRPRHTDRAGRHLWVSQAPVIRMTEYSTGGGHDSNA